jgi:hypothetical protein
MWDGRFFSPEFPRVERYFAEYVDAYDCANRGTDIESEAKVPCGEKDVEKVRRFAAFWDREENRLENGE